VTESRDNGFTLVELLIAMMVMGIILPAIGATFYIALRTTDDTNNRILDSHDIQSAAAFVNSDVQNAQTVATNDVSHCVSSAYPAATPADSLYLTWSDLANGGSVSHQVNYYVSGTSLIRSECSAGVPISAVAVIGKLDSTVLPDVVCQPTACNAATPPPSVALRGKTGSGQYFSLIGTRRTS
jgi:prepilin-type N-terminal cleavage/methylation domain-containing protein